jgi:hypothetical protein
VFSAVFRSLFQPESGFRINELHAAQGQRKFLQYSIIVQESDDIHQCVSDPKYSFHEFADQMKTLRGFEPSQGF